MSKPSSCDTCGGYRYVPCAVCHGSKKSLRRNHFTEEFQTLRCVICDENGLVKCDKCNSSESDHRHWYTYTVRNLKTNQYYWSSMIWDKSSLCWPYYFLPCANVKWRIIILVVESKWILFSCWIYYHVFLCILAYLYAHINPNIYVQHSSITKNAGACCWKYQ